MSTLWCCPSSISSAGYRIRFCKAPTTNDWNHNTIYSLIVQQVPVKFPVHKRPIIIFCSCLQYKVGCNATASKEWGCSSVGRASDRHATVEGSIPRCGKGFFSKPTFSANSLTCVRTPLWAIACIYICAYIKDPVVHVKVRWIMKALRHQARTVGWVERLCCSWLSPGKATRIPHGRSPNRTKQMLKKKKVLAQNVQTRDLGF